MMKGEGKQVDPYWIQKVEILFQDKVLAFVI